MKNKQLAAMRLLVDRPHLLRAHVNHEAGVQCWPCSLTKNASGYASIRVGSTSVLAHRAAYWLAFGPFELSLHVCHVCDTPACCNPAHLRLGTHADNMADMRMKGRRRGVTVGERNGRAKLSVAAAERIRALRGAGASLRVLAVAHGVSTSTVARVCSLESWA